MRRFGELLFGGFVVILITGCGSGGSDVCDDYAAKYVSAMPSDVACLDGSTVKAGSKEDVASSCKQHFDSNPNCQIQIDAGMTCWIAVSDAEFKRRIFCLDGCTAECGSAPSPCETEDVASQNCIGKP